MEHRKGRPTNNPKTIQTRIRMTQEEANKLNECANTLGVSKTEVIVKGINKIYTNLKKGK